MSICIDRNRNVIANMGGSSHRTGWVVIPVVKSLSGMEPAGWALSRGRGFHAGSLHKTEAWGAIIRLEVSLDALTVDRFQALTGWTAGAE